MPPAPPPDVPPPALALYLMGELQRYRAQGGPIRPVAQRFVLALGAARGAGIAPDVLERLAGLAQAPEPLDDAERRWLHSQLPEIVRRIVLDSPATNVEQRSYCARNSSTMAASISGWS